MTCAGPCSATLERGPCLAATTASGMARMTAAQASGPWLCSAAWPHTGAASSPLQSRREALARFAAALSIRLGPCGRLGICLMPGSKRFCRQPVAGSLSMPPARQHAACCRAAAPGSRCVHEHSRTAPCAVLQSCAARAVLFRPRRMTARLTQSPAPRMTARLTSKTRNRAPCPAYAPDSDGTAGVTRMWRWVMAQRPQMVCGAGLPRGRRGRRAVRGCARPAGPAGRLH